MPVPLLQGDFAMNHDQTTNAASDNSTHEGETRNTWREKLWRHRFSFLWVAVLGLIIAIQWPMIKGMLYTAVGAGTPDDGIAWRTSYHDALEESAATGKPVLLNFTADWCPPCRVMKHDVWPDEQVRQTIITSFIPVMVDVDEAQNAVVSRLYGVRAVPSILVVDAEGQVLRQGNFMSRNGMIEFLQERG
jgi:thiol:disulfide interchange protein